MEGLVRRVQPKFFAKILDDTVDFLTAIAHLEAGVCTKRVLEDSDPERKAAVLDAAIIDLVKKIRGFRQNLAEKSMQMAECCDDPTEIVS